ncbi:MAG TPA: hypothetical protein VNF47_26635 [Streptosporangiaceae bacterium]|nr:hypothetical protein [Streptosporangiaceae bacterium]
MTAAGLPRGLRAPLRARLAVALPRARGHVRAPVPPRQPLQLVPDPHLARVQVDVPPAPPERLALAQAARQPDQPAGSVPAAIDGGDDRPRAGESSVEPCGQVKD